MGNGHSDLLNIEIRSSLQVLVQREQYWYNPILTYHWLPDNHSSIYQIATKYQYKTPGYSSSNTSNPAEELVLVPSFRHLLLTPSCRPFSKIIYARKNLKTTWLVWSGLTVSWECSRSGDAPDRAILNFETYAMHRSHVPYISHEGKSEQVSPLQLYLSATQDEKSARTLGVLHMPMGGKPN